MEPVKSGGAPTPAPVPTAAAPTAPVTTTPAAAPAAPAPVLSPEDKAAQHKVAVEAKKAELNSERNDLQEFVTFLETQGKPVAPHTVSRIAEIDKALEKLGAEEKYGALKVQAESDAAKYATLGTGLGSFKVTIEVGAFVEGKQRTVSVTVGGKRDTTAANNGQAKAPKAEGTGGESAAKASGCTVNGVHYDSGNAAWNALIAEGSISAEKIESSKAANKHAVLKGMAGKGLITYERDAEPTA